MWKTLLRKDILELWLRSGWSKSRFAYALWKAKNQGSIDILWRGIYWISDIDHISHPDLDSHYWEIVSLLIREYAFAGAIIAHEKSLELLLKNFEIPDCLVLYTRDTAKRIVIGPYEFHFRVLRSWEKSSSKNMFRIFMETAIPIKIENITFHTLSIEATLLDVARLNRKEKGISEDSLIRFIKKYEKSYDRNKMWVLVSHRYIRSINRVRSIAKMNGFLRLYEMTLDIIKKEWGWCYLHL